MRGRRPVPCQIADGILKCRVSAGLSELLVAPGVRRTHRFVRVLGKPTMIYPVIIMAGLGLTLIVGSIAALADGEIWYAVVRLAMGTVISALAVYILRRKQLLPASLESLGGFEEPIRRKQISQGPDPVFGRRERDILGALTPYNWGSCLHGCRVVMANASAEAAVPCLYMFTTGPLDTKPITSVSQYAGFCHAHLVPNGMGIPRHVDQHSELMSITIPRS